MQPSQKYKRDLIYSKSLSSRLVLLRCLIKCPLDCGIEKIRYKKQFMYLANKVNPEVSISLYNAYQDATQVPHGYLIVDLTQDTKDGLRFRTNVFPTNKYHLTVYRNIGDEACEIKLSYSPSAQDS